MAGFKSSEDDYLPIPNVKGGGVDCAYPNCRKGKVTGETPYVQWSGALDLEQIYTVLPAVVKLALQENKSDYIKKYNQLPWHYLIHAECAAEWGMHMIKDAMKAEGNVGRILSNRKHTRERN
jgi:hypothetical protein